VTRQTGSSLDSTLPIHFTTLISVNFWEVVGTIIPPGTSLLG